MLDTTTNTYTIKSVMATGKSSPMYGTEYYVQFNEIGQSFPLWFKTEPAIGHQINGTIEGTKFKKEKKEWNPNGATPSQASQPTVGSSTPKPAYKDNSDGMRQGMCINNAANYVANSGDEVLSAKGWAETVHAYATALYSLGDLVKTEPEDDTLESVKDMFGVTAVPANK